MTANQIVPSTITKKLVSLRQLASLSTDAKNRAIAEIAIALESATDEILAVKLIAKSCWNSNRFIIG